MKKKTLGIILFILILAFVWGQSLMPKGTSARESSWLTSNIINPVLKFFGLKSISSALIRKIAHVTEFTALSFVTFNLFERKLKNIPKVVLIGFIIAFLDETIQIFSSRGPQIQDVWIDLIGVGIGTLLGFLLLSKKKKD